LVATDPDAPSACADSGYAIMQGGPRASAVEGAF